MKAVEIISIPVSDQEEAKQFYVNKLGFNLIYEGATPDGGKWIQIGLPNDNVAFTIVPKDTGVSSGALKGTVIITDNIEQDIKNLKWQGIKAEEIQEFPHGKISSFVDPDGNQWVLRQP